MKTKIVFAAFAALFLGLTSCNKDENEMTQSALDASKTEQIKMGEPVNFTFSPAPDQSPVIWSVVPDEDAEISASGNTAAIIFRNPGTYSVNAAYDNLKGSVEVMINDSIYNPGGNTPTYEPLTDDQIFITVTRYDSMGLSGLDFRYITEKKYNCLNHTLLFDNIFTGQNLKIIFNSVFIPDEEFCQPGEDYATGGTAWYPVEEGSHGFEVVLDGVTYTGSFIKNGSTYTFTWPYTSGVTITPLVIQ
jgi:hypothetical protein